MKRCLAASSIAALAVVAPLAGCGVAQNSANAKGPASGSPSAAGTSSGPSAHLTASPKPSAGEHWLPVLTSRQVAADHLLPQRWKLLRVRQGGTAVEISYFFGPCVAAPKGVLVNEHGMTVSLSLEGPNPHVTADCFPLAATRTAWVRIPGLRGRTLRQ